MKRNIVLIMALLTIFVLLTGCKSADTAAPAANATSAGIATAAEQKTTEQGMEQDVEQQVEKSGGDDNKLFELKLYTDKETYKTTDKIKIWATLQYNGSDDQIKIWHSNPYISFSITDGKDFNTGNTFDDILTSTILERDKLYTFDYTKSGGYSEDDPDAGFWKKFYSEKDLYLPEGEYTVAVGGAFSFTEDIQKTRSNLSRELRIKVAK